LGLAISERPILPGDFNEIDHEVLRAQTRIFGEDLRHAFIELPLLLRFAPGAQGDLHEHHAVGALNTKKLRVVDQANRVVLQSRGFGFVVLYNGRESRKLKSGADAHQKGVSDAQNAASLARQEGFPSGTVIFLDIEEGGRLPESYHEYVRTWFDELARLRFKGGAYCSAIPVDEGQGRTIITAKDLEDHLGGRQLVFWVFNDVCPPSPGCVFSNIPPIAQSGFPAEVWQFAQTPRRKERTANCAASYAPDGNCYAPEDTAHKWFIDANVATSPNPSAPRK